MTTSLPQSPGPKRENPLLNLAFNLAIPIFVLEKSAQYLGANGPLKALILALCFPVAYGIYDWVKRKKANWMSALGMLSVLITGGLALAKVEGIWFAISEASLPSILGLGVMASAFTSKPFVASFIMNDSVMNLDLIKSKLHELGREEEFKRLLKHSTLFFSASFFLSAVLNFALAQHIFVPIDPSLAEEVRSQTLNEQLAQMRYWSIFVIMIPMFIFGLFVMWHLLRGLFKTTELRLEQIMRSQ